MLNQMDPRLREKYDVFASLMSEARIPFGLNEVLRTHIKQLAYVAQGRSFAELLGLCDKYKWSMSANRIRKLRQDGKNEIEICDIFRIEAGLYPLKGKEWYKITKTLNSKHFANKAGFSEAFDIKIFTADGKVTWDSKWDADMDGVPEYLEAARLGKKAGLDAGGLWSQFKDYPHYQLPKGA